MCPLTTMLLPVLMLPMGQLPRPEGAERVFYPTAVGSKWTYAMNVGGKEEELVEAVTAVEEAKDGAKLVTVEKVRADGQRLSAVKVLATRDGVYHTESHGGRIEPPICRLRLPAQIGDQWKTDHVIGGGVKMQLDSRISGVEKVAVPAGTFDAIRVDFTCTGGYRGTMWYVDGIGVVKTNSPDMPNNNLVLKSFTPGKE